MPVPLTPINLLHFAEIVDRENVCRGGRRLPLQTFVFVCWRLGFKLHRIGDGLIQ